MKFLIIDDHHLYLEGIKAIISKFFPRSTSLAAHKIDDAFNLLSIHNDIDIVLLDIYMPNGGASVVLKKMYKEKYTIPILVISASENSADVQMAMNQGALGYLPKSSTPSQLKNAINTILEGNEYLPEGWDNSIRNSKNITVLAGEENISISPRLYEVLQLIEKGCTSMEISQFLNLSNHTVKGYIKELFSRFNVHNRTELIQTARQLHFFSFHH